MRCFDPPTAMPEPLLCFHPPLKLRHGEGLGPARAQTQTAPEINPQTAARSERNVLTTESLTALAGWPEDGSAPLTYGLMLHFDSLD